MKFSGKVLIVDDDTDGLAAMVSVVRGAGYKTLEAENGEQAVELMRERGVEILVSDVQLPGIDGLQLLRAAKTHNAEIEVILVTAYGIIETAVEALRDGAYDFVTKPIKKALLLRTIERAAEKQQLRRENRTLRSQLNGKRQRILHASAAMRNIATMAEQVGSSTATVLITGESGTGKEVVADAIHAASPRRDRPMIKISCAAMPETLLESELFGYEKGAFTGASAKKEGRFELAHGGTLFLDEIGEITTAMQVKLLRVLQDGKFERLGGSRTIETDVRIICATNKDLQRELAEHRFREDLFYRLNVVEIHLPPLRDRKDDIPLLALHFLKVYLEKNRKNIDGFSESAMQALMSYDWPGNVRELENAVERAVVLTNTNIIPLSVLPHVVPALSESRHSLKFKIGMPWREIERQAIEITLAHTRGDKRVAARLLGVSPRTIYRHVGEQEPKQGKAEEVKVLSASSDS